MLGWLVGLSDPVFDLYLAGFFVVAMMTGHVKIVRIGWTKTDED